MNGFFLTTCASAVNYDWYVGGLRPAVRFVLNRKIFVEHHAT